MRRIVVIYTLLLCFFAGCQQDALIEGDRQVTVSFSPQTLTSSLKLSSASQAENSIVKLMLYGVDAQGNVTQNFPVFENPVSTGIPLTIFKGVKSLYAIANPSSDLIAANPSNLSELMNLTFDFTNAPQSPFLMGGKGDINGSSVQIELIRAVAKIEILSKNEFQINTVTVKNLPDEGYVFKQESPSSPASAGLTDYPAVNSANPVLYVPETGKDKPAEFLVTGTYLGKQASYTIVLKSGTVPIDIERNTHYQVSVSAITDTDCSVAVSIPAWNDYSTTISQTITVPKPVTPPDNPYQNGIKILAIGNSYAQNTLIFLHVMLKQLGIPTANIKIVNAYVPGGGLSTHAGFIRSNNWSGTNEYGDPVFEKQTFPDITSTSSNIIWTRNVTLRDIIKEENWDVITLQSVTTGWENPVFPSTAYADMECVLDFIRTESAPHTNYKVGWHSTWASGQTSDNPLAWTQRICTIDQNNIAPKLKPNSGAYFDYIIPVGTAIQNGRKFFGGSVLNSASPTYGLKPPEYGYTDYDHLNNVGCYLAGAMWIKVITGYDITGLTVPYTILGTFSAQYNGMAPVEINQTMFNYIVQAVNAAYDSPYVPVP